MSSSHVKILVIEMPRLDRLEPDIVVAQDKTTDKVVIVKGENFVDRNLTCFFDDQPSDATFISESAVLCRFRLPKNSEERDYEVRISNGGALGWPQYLILELVVPPSIAALNPTMGQTGSVVTITGKSFHPNMMCQFGSQIVETHFVNSTLMQCIASAVLYRESTPVSIALFGAPVSSGPRLLFTFIDLSIHSISPTFGHVTGGTRVTFNLKEETPDVVSHCMFGSHIVPAIVDQLKLVCVSPPSLAHGPMHVGVSVNGEDFSLSELNFEYTKPAVFSTMRPTSGPESGSTVVVLTGSNFVNSSTAGCYFGNVKVAGRWESDERLTCETPAIKPGN